MSDFERYGDYNEYDGDEKKKNPIGLILKIIIALACVSVVGILGFRIFLFNYYPSSMKNIYFSENLKEYYDETDGNIGALTQNYPYMYDDEEEGNFFAGNVIVVRGAGEIQFSVRYNKSLFDTLEEKYGTNLDCDSKKIIFTLERNPRDEESDPEIIGTLTHSGTDTAIMYTYHKLVFSGIDFGEGDDRIRWLRVRITFDGVDIGKDEYLIAVYHDHDDFNEFEEYELSKSEVPADD